MNAGKPGTRPTLRLGKAPPPKVAAMVAAVRAPPAPPPKVKIPPPLPGITSPATHAQRAAWRVEDLAACRARFGTLFDHEHPLPLAIGIHKQLAGVIGAKRAGRLLEWWTAWGPYVAAIAAGGARYNLDGSEAGEITDSQRDRARATLKLTEPSSKAA